MASYEYHTFLAPWTSERSVSHRPASEQPSQRTEYVSKRYRLVESVQQSYLPQCSDWSYQSKARIREQIAWPKMEPFKQLRLFIVPYVYPVQSLLLTTGVLTHGVLQERKLKLVRSSGLTMASFRLCTGHSLQFLFSPVSRTSKRPLYLHTKLSRFTKEQTGL